MQTISIKDTRNNLAELIEKVAIGKKTFIITKFGKPKAQIVPLKKTMRKNKNIIKLPGFGMWADREDMKDSAKWVAKIRSQWKSRYEPST